MKGNPNENRKLKIESRKLDFKKGIAGSPIQLLISSLQLRSGITICLIVIGLSMIFQFQSNAQSLDDYYKIAAENNPGLQAKYKAFEAAMQKTSQVGSLPDPTLSFGYFISPVETRVGPQKARFSLTQMFPWFGTLSAQKETVTLLAEAKYQEFLDARNQLFFQVANSYFALNEVHELASIERENIRILQSYKNIANVKFENNQGSLVDVLRVDIMLKDAETTLSILEKKKKPLGVTFNQLLNREPTDSIQVDDEMLTAEFQTEERNDSLLLDNPMLEELELKIKAAEASEASAIKQGLPKLGVGLDYVIIGERTDMSVADNGRDAIMPMVTVSLPIFRAKYKAAQKEAVLMQESYQLQRENLLNTLEGNYEMGLFKLSQQRELIDLYDQQMSESEQSLNLLFKAYGNSGKDFEEVLRMQQQLLKYQKMKVAAITQYQIALSELDYLTAKQR